MRIGVPTECKNGEFRVAITPAGVHELVARGHEVVIQRGAGLGSSLRDEDFAQQGAVILDSAAEVWGAAELVLKVKEPVAAEYPLLREDLTLFTYLHLAANRPCTDALLDSGTTAIAYETVQLPDGSLPLLHPMSEVAGCLAPQVGSYYLTRSHGGRGVLLGGIGGVASAKVVILGGGVSGQKAADVALGMGADVTILDRDLDKLRQVYWRWHGAVRQLASSKLAIREQVLAADLVIGTVLIPGASTPCLVTNEMVSQMKPGSVLVDVSVDQGGCMEDSRPTTHEEPVFRVHGSTFYCVANMPGAVPNTSTFALTNSTLPYVLEIAEKGWAAALRTDTALRRGLNTHAGRVTHPGVADSLGIEWVDPAPLVALS